MNWTQRVDWTDVRRVRAAAVLVGVAVGVSVAIALVYIVIRKTTEPTPPGRQFPWAYVLVMFTALVSLVSALLWVLGVALLSRVSRFTNGPLAALIGGAAAASVGTVLVYWFLFGWRDPFEWTLSAIKFTAPVGGVVGLVLERVARRSIAPAASDS